MKKVDYTGLRNSKISNIRGLRKGIFAVVGTKRVTFWELEKGMYRKREFTKIEDCVALMLVNDIGNTNYWNQKRAKAVVNVFEKEIVKELNVSTFIFLKNSKEFKAKVNDLKEFDGIKKVEKYGVEDVDSYTIKLTGDGVCFKLKYLLNDIAEEVADLFTRKDTVSCDELLAFIWNPVISGYPVKVKYENPIKPDTSNCKIELVDTGRKDGKPDMIMEHADGVTVLTGVTPTSMDLDQPSPDGKEVTFSVGMTPPIEPVGVDIAIRDRSAPRSYSAAGMLIGAEHGPVEHEARQDAIEGFASDFAGTTDGVELWDPISCVDGGNRISTLIDGDPGKLKVQSYYMHVLEPSKFKSDQEAEIAWPSEELINQILRKRLGDSYPGDVDEIYRSINNAAKDYLLGTSQHESSSDKDKLITTARNIIKQGMVNMHDYLPTIKLAIVVMDNGVYDLDLNYLCDRSDFELHVGLWCVYTTKIKDGIELHSVDRDREIIDPVDEIEVYMHMDYIRDKVTVDEDTNIPDEILNLLPLLTRKVLY